MGYTHVLFFSSLLPGAGLVEVIEDLRLGGFRVGVVGKVDLAGTVPEQVLFIGSNADECAEAGRLKGHFALALWQGASVRHVFADFYFWRPEEILYVLQKIRDPFEGMQLVKWGMEIQFIAQAGLTYSKDHFDKERFARLREIAAEVLSLQTGFSVEKVKDLFCNETGFQTPKMDTRAAIFQDEKILLVQERNGTWSLPGGWVDVNESIKTNTVKEVREEAGLEVVPVRLIAVQDRNRHNVPAYAYGIAKSFVLCEIVGGAFEENTETISSAYFACDQLPMLATEKNNAAQIEMCFEAWRSAHWETVFD